MDNFLAPDLCFLSVRKGEKNPSSSSHWEEEPQINASSEVKHIVQHNS